MAALLIAAGLMVHNRVEKRREAKRLKKKNDEDRYEILQDETRKRLSRTVSGSVVERAESPGGSERDSGESGERDREKTPAYHDVVGGGGKKRKKSGPLVGGMYSAGATP